jgi:hypothetical protein
MKLSIPVEISANKCELNFTIGKRKNRRTSKGTNKKKNHWNAEGIYEDYRGG